jgi:uncharacterized protein YdiU (UPF0061 family)
MHVGFIHGVMNTDNTSISGETIDYGPCAFMDAYDPATVFSSIDEGGRYAYANQPRIALWNLTRLAECLLPLFSDDQEKAVADPDVAAGDVLETSDHAQRRRLAAAGRPDEGHEFLVGDLEIDVFYGVEQRAIMLVELAE